MLRAHLLTFQHQQTLGVVHAWVATLPVFARQVERVRRFVRRNRVEVVLSSTVIGLGSIRSVSVLLLAHFFYNLRFHKSNFAHMN